LHWPSPQWSHVVVWDGLPAFVPHAFASVQVRVFTLLQSQSDQLVQFHLTVQVQSGQLEKVSEQSHTPLPQ